MARISFFLEEGMHSRLRELARAQGRSISHVVRAAILHAFSTTPTSERERTLQAIVGLWADRKDIPDGSAYVRSLRRSTHRPSGRNS